MTEHHMASPGKLIVLEGIDGAGTTTQARLVFRYLQERSIPAHLTREPSDGPIGVLLRQFLAGYHAIPGAEIGRDTLALLFAADRADHVQREVGPRLAAGEFVLSDRWYHSSFAYQGNYTKPAWDFHRVSMLNAYVREPDLTIFLRTTPEIAAQRRRDAGRTREIFDDLEVQRQVAAGYDAAMSFCADRGQRVMYVNGNADLDVVTNAVRQLIEAELLAA